MNGRYRIPLRVDESPEDNPRVQALLQSLDPGAKVSYRVWEEPLEVRYGDGNGRTGCFDRKALATVPGKAFNHPHTEPATRYVLIVARGGKAKKSKPSTVGLSTPAVPGLDVLQKRLKEAETKLTALRGRLRSEMRRQWHNDGLSFHNNEWLTEQVAKRARNRRLGKAVAKILARHGKRSTSYADARKHAFRFQMQTDLKPTADDYALLDKACGRKVDRASKIGDTRLDMCHGYLGYIVRSFTMSYRYGVVKEEPKVEEVKVDPKASKWVLPPQPEGGNTIDSFLRAKGEVEYLRDMIGLRSERAEGKTLKQAA